MTPREEAVAAARDYEASVRRIRRNIAGRRAESMRREARASWLSILALNACLWSVIIGAVWWLVRWIG